MRPSTIVINGKMYKSVRRGFHDTIGGTSWQRRMFSKRMHAAKPGEAVVYGIDEMRWTCRLTETRLRLVK